MLIGKSTDLRYSQVTPRTIYLNRRRFLAAGSAAIGALSLRAASNGSKLTASKSPFSTTEPPTPFDAITHYNNFYEFGTDKEDPSKNAHKLADLSLVVKMEGEVGKPTVLQSGRSLQGRPARRTHLPAPLR